MNSRERASFEVLQGFNYRMIMGVDTTVVPFKKGQVLSLRVHSKMARQLVADGIVKRVEAVPDGNL